MKILLTGVSGFIGSHLAPVLADQGHEVIGLVREKNEVTGITAIEMDLAQGVEVQRLPAKIDAVVHLAQGMTEDDMLPINTLATDILVRYAIGAGASRFVFTSTGNVYRPSADPVKEVDPLDFQTSNKYTLSKVMAERLLRLSWGKLPIVIARLFVPYGPGQQGRMIPGLLARVLDNKTIVLKNGGQPRTNPIHINDCVKQLVRLIELGQSGILNIGGTADCSIREITEIMGRLADRQVTYEETENPDNFNLVGSISELVRFTGLTPAIELEHGIRELVMSQVAV